MGSSSNRNRTTNRSDVRDERIAVNNGAQALRTTSGDITLLDGGAIDLARTISERAFLAAEGIGDLASGITMRSLDLAEDSLNKTNDAFQDFADKTRSDQAQFLTN